MPYRGKFYSVKEVREILHVNRARVHAIAKRQGWTGPTDGLYYAECVEPFLLYRGIDPACLPVVEYAPMAEYSPGQEKEAE